MAKISMPLAELVEKGAQDDVVRELLRIGLGFGYVNLVYIVSVQSAVGWEQRGAATASNLFMRQLGQAIGTAAFGAIFNLRLAARIPHASDIVTRMMNPAQRVDLPMLDVQRYAGAIAASLHAIYVILGLLGVFVLLLALALPAKMRASDAAAKA